MKNWGKEVFADCVNLVTLNINNVKEIGDYAFATTTEKTANSLTALTFGDELEVVGNYAFYGSLNIVDVTIGNGLKEIGSYAFATCRSLETINVGAKLKTQPNSSPALIL